MFKFRNVIFEKSSFAGYMLILGFLIFSVTYALIEFPSHKALITTLGFVAFVYLMSSDAQSLLYVSSIVLLLVARANFPEYATEFYIVIGGFIAAFSLYEISKPVNHEPLKFTDSGFLPQKENEGVSEVAWDSITDVYFDRTEDPYAGIESKWILHLKDGSWTCVYVEWPFSWVFLKALLKHCSAVDPKLARQAARKWKEGRWHCGRRA